MGDALTLPSVNVEIQDPCNSFQLVLSPVSMCLTLCLAMNGTFPPLHTVGFQYDLISRLQYHCISRFSVFYFDTFNLQ